MKALLTFVFVALVASLGAAVAAAQPARSDDAAPTLLRDGSKLRLSSASVLVFDANSGRPIYAKSADSVTRSASWTKLMTARVFLCGGQNLDGWNGV